MANTNYTPKQGTLGYLKPVVVGLILVWLVKSGAFDFSLFSKILNPVPWLLGLFFVFMCIFINNFRWKLLLNAISFPLSNLYLLKLSLAAVFYSFVAPGGVGGDVVKGFYLYKQNHISKSKVALSIIFDRGSGLIAMLVMAAVAGFFYINFENGQNEKLIDLIEVIFVILIVSVLGALLFFWQGHRGIKFLGKYLSNNLIEKITEVYDVSVPLIGQLFISVVVSVLAQGFLILLFYNLSGFLDYHLPLSTFFIFVPLGMICSALPLSPAGVGVGQAAYFYLFNLYDGKSGPLGVLGFTFFQVLLLIWGVVGIVVSFIEGKKVTDVR